MKIGLVAGVNVYAGNNLQGCINDTEAMQGLMQGLGFSTMHIRVLRDSHATKQIGRAHV